MIKSEHKYALTGTPMENSPDELWSILNLLFPDRFNSYWRFVEQWCSVECGVTPQGKEYRKVTGCSNPKGLHDMLAPLMIRRLKENVLEELPQKVRSTISVDLLPKDRSIYTKLQKEMIAELPSGEIVITPNIISMITRLRQVSISHSLLSSEDKNVKSAKITAAMDLINDNKISHKVLVFSRFNEAIKLLKLSLDKEKVRYVEITGNVPADKRKDAENRFQNDPNIRVIVGTIGAMGEGYTLTAGDIVIFLDKHDNPQKNKQAEDRAYRIGQVNMVNIISLIASDTWEELVEAKLQMKLSMSDEVIDGIKCEGHLYSDVLAESLHEIRSL
jgi:SNF2 family DNA or RNA helicase